MSNIQKVFVGFIIGLSLGLSAFYTFFEVVDSGEYSPPRIEVHK